MREYIFKYLDKRYPIEDGVIHLIDKRPHQRIEDLFDIGCGWGIIYEWAQSRIGEYYTIQFLNGALVWYKNGQRHREDGPAYIGSDGTEMWYKEGQRHREDGPAYIGSDGTEMWYKEGQRHREGGPACIYPNKKEWFQNDLRHREDGPAIIWRDGYQEWYKNGGRFKGER